MIQVWGHHPDGFSLENNANCIPLILRPYLKGGTTFQNKYLYLVSGHFGRYVNNAQPYTKWLDGIDIPDMICEHVQIGKCIVVVDDSCEVFGSQDIIDTLNNFASRNSLDKSNFVFNTSNLSFPDLEFCDVYRDNFVLEFCAFSILGRDTEYYNKIKNIRGSDWHHRFISIGGEPRDHRVKYHNLLRSKYTDGISTINPGLRLKSNLSFTPETSPYEDPVQTEPYIWHDINPCHYIHVPVATVMETYIDKDHVCITEKAFKNLIYPQPFVILGASGIVERLRQLGFDVYDEYVDHSYDIIQDDNQRISAVLESFEKLFGRYDFPKEKQIAEHNRDVAEKLSIAENFVKYLSAKLLTK